MYGTSTDGAPMSIQGVSVCVFTVVSVTSKLSVPFAGSRFSVITSVPSVLHFKLITFSLSVLSNVSITFVMSGLSDVSVTAAVLSDSAVTVSVSSDTSVTITMSVLFVSVVAASGLPDMFMTVFTPVLSDVSAPSVTGLA
ncbi:hypothetical protein NP493_5666g00002 [Ridgeia piscesae]|uniref:Uncharacterized protein n=1 Tax=Ridgeia piscesae TaxID=27915 RepID=A0AAD9MNR8_RIDPI|nr:hypothetical protein NP493_5666g00002 [Ridgeia piscesae]